MTKKKITAIVIAAVLVLGVAAAAIFNAKSKTRAQEVSTEWAQEFVNSKFDEMAAIKPALKYIAEKNHVTVNEVSYGDGKSIILDCSVETIDVYNALCGHYDEFLGTTSKKGTGLKEKSSLELEVEFEDGVMGYLEEANELKTDTQIVLYETDGGVELHSSRSAVNAVYGGIIDVEDEVKKIEKVKAVDENGNEYEKEIEAKNIKNGFLECISARYVADKPDTSGWFGRMINTLKKELHTNLIEHDRWKTIIDGLWVTLKLTFFSAIIGIVLGFLVAFVRCTYLKNTKRGIFLKIFNAICQVYLTVIRGTPAVVQIMIIYFVIFMPIGVAKFPAAVVCFGLNSGAYVAEIVRGGIMSVDAGQTEAGRSLGFNYMQTMFYIVFPQAFKAVLPSLANEFVVLLKETSVAFYIGLGDLMYAGNAIRAATYSPYTASIVVAIIYFIMVMILSKLVGLLERRLRNSER